MAQTVYTKDPDAVCKKFNDWSEWLDNVSDTIVSTSFSASSGLTVDSSGFSGSTTWVFLSGGEAGTLYSVTNRIVTTGGRTEDRTFYVKVIER